MLVYRYYYYQRLCHAWFSVIVTLSTLSTFNLSKLNIGMMLIEQESYRCFCCYSTSDDHEEPLTFGDFVSFKGAWLALTKQVHFQAKRNFMTLYVEAVDLHPIITDNEATVAFENLCNYSVQGFFLLIQFKQFCLIKLY